MKKIYLETFGCQMNVSDSERVATLLESNGYQMTAHETSADVVIFNTCSVRDKAEHKLYSRIGEIRHTSDSNQIVGVMGCVAQLEGETLFNKARGINFVVGTKAAGRIHETIEKVIATKKEVIDLGERSENYDWSVSESQRHSPYIAFVPIIEGCNKFCTYCIVPFSRGRERSLSPELITEEIKRLKDTGIKEIHLIGQNVNSYRPFANKLLQQFPGATAFSKLLRAVAATGIERIKFATSFPRDFHPDIVAAIEENENLCNWVHLPVQSGSDRILRAMRRGHTVENYKKRIDIIRGSKKNIAISTDIIIGFPGETDSDFEATRDLIEYCEYDFAYIYKYSARSGTPAAALPDDVSAEKKTERFIELEKTQKSIQKRRWSHYVNTKLEVLVERKSTKNPKEFAGHSRCQKIVNFSGDGDFLGKLVNVKITESKNNSLYGIVK